MKTLFYLSFVFAGGIYFFSGTPSSSTTIKAYKTSKTKRTFSSPIAPIRVVIDKSDYEMHVYDAEGWYATYPVVFGSNSLADKKMEGDRLTPEGDFKIVSKRVHEKWNRFMALDYPTKASLEKFNQRRLKGEIPKNASPGGGIGIHGTWPREDFAIDRYSNWTNGCIALKNEDVQDVYRYLQIGTPVSIKR